MTGIEMIAKERQEQLEKHGRTVTDDVEFNDEFQLADAAHELSNPDIVKDPEDTLPKWWDLPIWTKMWNKSYKERLIIAGALIAAELDRLEGTE